MAFIAALTVAPSSVLLHCPISVGYCASSGNIIARRLMKSAFCS